MDNIIEVIDFIKSHSDFIGISSTEVSLAKDLAYGKNKDETTFLCEGLWAVEKLIEKKIKVSHFFFNAEKLSPDLESEKNISLISKMVKYSKKSYAISEKACKKISDRDGYDEYFIIAEMPKYSLSDIPKLTSNSENVMSIVMDGLEQPGNIGAILRSFDSAGGNFAVIVNKQAKLNNSRLIRSSLGSAFMIPVIETDIDSAQKWFEENNYKCILTDLQAKKSFKDADYSGKIAIVAGNEHRGISPSWRELKCHESIIIPMLGSCESLNVGFASTLVCYEAGLQKFYDKISLKN